VDEIESALLQFIDEARSGTWRRPSSETVASFSRRSQAGQLARLLDSILLEQGLTGA
jgi:hypothetical protein